MGKYDYLMHFNPFHDPKNGQFTSGGSGLSGIFGRNKASASNRSTPPKGTPEYDEAKQRVLKEGTATDVLKYKNDLTIGELQAAFNRINLERSLANISAQELASGKSKADSMFDAIAKGTRYLNTATNAIEGARKLRDLISSKPKSKSQTLADKFLDDMKDVTNLGEIDAAKLKEMNGYLSSLSNIERMSKGSSGKNK